MQLPGLGGGAFVSAMSELLDVIRMQNAKPLVTGLCEQFRGILEALSQNVKSVAALLERDVKNKEEKAQQEARQQKKSSLRRARQFTDLPGEGLVGEETKSIVTPTAAADAPEQVHAPTVEEVGGDDDAAFNGPVITPFSSDFSDDSDDSDSSDSSAISEDSDSDGDYEQPEGEEEEESSDDDDQEEVGTAQVANGSQMPVVTAWPSGAAATQTVREESMAQSGDASGGTASEESLDNCTIEELKAMISREIMEASPPNDGKASAAEAKAAPAPPDARVSGTPHSVARATCDKSWNRYRRFLAGAAAKGVEVWPPKVQDRNQQAGARLSHAPKRARMETPAPVPA